MSERRASLEKRNVNAELLRNKRRPPSLWEASDKSTAEEHRGIGDGMCAEVEVAKDGTLAFCLRKEKLRELCRREGRYLLRSNLCTDDPGQIWQLYMLLWRP